MITFKIAMILIGGYLGITIEEKLGLLRKAKN